MTFHTVPKNNGVEIKRILQDPCGGRSGPQDILFCGKVIGSFNTFQVTKVTAINTNMQNMQPKRKKKKSEYWQRLEYWQPPLLSNVTKIMLEEIGIHSVGVLSYWKINWNGEKLHLCILQLFQVDRCTLESNVQFW